MAARQVIINKDITFTMSRRLMPETLGTKEKKEANMHGFEAKVALEIAGPVNETTGRLIAPEVLDEIIEDEILKPFDHMMVLRFDDPVMETLANKPVINNNGWRLLMKTITDSINEKGYYDTRRQSFPAFYDSMRPLPIGQHPTSENLAYLIHRILSPHLYKHGITGMKVRFSEKSTYNAVFLGDVKETPDFPQVVPPKEL